MSTDRLPPLRRLERRKYAVLFTALASLIIAGPLLHGGLVGKLVLAGLLTSVGAAGVLTMVGLHQGLRVIGVLAMLAVLATWAGAGAESMIVPAGFTQAAFELGLSLIILKDVLFGNQRFDSERLFGAAAIYLLVAAGCAELYLLIEHFEPNSFYLPEGIAVFDRQQAHYFSFVTQTTLGFGDLSPRSQIARGLTIAQATLGVLYIAILVARLAGNTGGPKEADGEG